ncbi:conjugal transfer protein TraH [Alteromonas macleodii]|uniref:conjugal transfer protein TraH n=1 Tax=Alteromonas macleodii TaxID=28108 RepID=UPI0031404F97
MTNFKKTFKAFIAAILLGSSNYAFADGLSDAFNDFQTSSTSAGAYKTKSRVAATLGSFSARTPTTRISLFNYTPPRLSAGCGGVDAHFGGFSFVNGIDFQQLVANVGQNALGLVIHLAIKVGCEQCHSVLEQIQEWAQFAAKLSIDSCMAAKSLLSIGGAASDLCSAMASVSADVGLNDDESAAQGRCDSEVNSWNTYQDVLSEDKNPAGGSDGQAVQQYVSPCDNAPNKAWCMLTKMKMLPTTEDTTGGSGKLIPMSWKQIDNDLTGDEKETALRRLGFSEIIMNIIPTQNSIMDAQKDETAGSAKKSLSSMDMAYKLYNFAVCGNPDLHNGTWGFYRDMFKPHCTEAWDAYEDFEINVCAPNGVDSNDPNWVDCESQNESMDITTWADSRKFFDGVGLYLIIAESLDLINKAIVDGTTPLTTEQKSFIGAAPIPLYQLFNLSATYPDIAENVIQPASVYLADIIANQFFLSHFTKITRGLNTKDVDEKGLELVKSMIKEMHSPFINEDVKKISAENFNHDRAWREFLMGNLATYQKLMLSDIADQQFGANLSASYGSVVHLKKTN